MGVAIDTLLPQIDGMIATMPTTAAQAVGKWLEQVKSQLRLTSVRDQTDWAFECSTDVDETGNAVRTGASTVYALLIGTNSADAERDIFCLTDAASNTFDGSAALDNDDLFTYQLPAAGTDGTEELHGHVFSQGIPCGTGITLSADGRDGTNPAADDVRAWILYREA